MVGRERTRAGRGGDHATRRCGRPTRSAAGSTPRTARPTTSPPCCCRPPSGPTCTRCTGSRATPTSSSTTSTRPTRPALLDLGRAVPRRPRRRAGDGRRTRSAAPTMHTDAALGHPARARSRRSSPACGWTSPSPATRRTPTSRSTCTARPPSSACRCCRSSSRVDARGRAATRASARRGVPDVELHPRRRRGPRSAAGSTCRRRTSTASASPARPRAGRGHAAGPRAARASRSPAPARSTRAPSPASTCCTRRSRDCIRTAFALYGGILDAVEKADYQVLTQRVSVPLPRRLAVALPAALHARSAPPRAGALGAGGPDLAAGRSRAKSGHPPLVPGTPGAGISSRTRRRGARHDGRHRHDDPARPARRRPPRDRHLGARPRDRVVGFRGRAHRFAPVVSAVFEGARGTLSLLEGGQGSVDVDVDVASLTTGCAAYDEVLARVDPFDAGRHPVARFRSTWVAWSAGAAVVEGTLSAGGGSAPVTLSGTYRATGGGRSCRPAAPSIAARSGSPSTCQGWGCSCRPGSTCTSTCTPCGRARTPVPAPAGVPRSCGPPAAPRPGCQGGCRRG